MITVFKKRYIRIGFITLLLIVVVKITFNLSFSLPTTFAEIVERKFGNQFEDVVELHINESRKIDPKTGQLTPQTDDRIIVIPMHANKGSETPNSQEKDGILLLDESHAASLLTNNTRIYQGGWVGSTSKQYSLCLHFRIDTNCYYIAEKYIIDSNYKWKRTYKVLDEHNEIYDYIESLFAE